MAHGLTPDRRAAGIRDVTPEYLRDMGVCGVIAASGQHAALPDAVYPTEDGAAWLASIGAGRYPGCRCVE